MIYFIVNNSACKGQGGNTWKKLRKCLEKKQISYKAYVTRYKGHATELARKISLLNNSDINIVVVGGDGTFNEVINGIVDFEKVHLGIIPSGSGNDFARGAGLMRNVGDCIDAIIECDSDLLLDLGCVHWWDNGVEKTRLFAISSGVGMDAVVCKRALTSRMKKVLNAFHIGKLTYVLLTLRTIMSMQFTRCSIRYDDASDAEYDKMIFCAAMNLRAEGGGVPMAPDAQPDDGMLSMCTGHGIPRVITFFILPILVMAKHTGLKCFDIRNCRQCDIKLDSPVVLHTDGEYCQDVDHIQYECVNELLHLIDTRKRR